MLLRYLKSVRQLLVGGCGSPIPCDLVVQSSNITRSTGGWPWAICRMYGRQSSLRLRMLESDMPILPACSRPRECSLWSCGLWGLAAGYFSPLFSYHGRRPDLCPTFDSCGACCDIPVEYVGFKDNARRGISSGLKLVTWKRIHGC